MKRNYILSSDLPQFSETLEELEGKGYCDELYGRNMAKKPIDITLIYPIQIRIAAADKVKGAVELLDIVKQHEADFILIDLAGRSINPEILDQERKMGLHAAEGKFGKEKIIDLSLSEKD
jgi:hypothetical protein